MPGATEAAKRWAREQQRKEWAKGHAEGYAEGYAQGRADVLRFALERLRPLADEHSSTRELVAELEANLSELLRETASPPKPPRFAPLAARLRKCAIM